MTEATSASRAWSWRHAILKSSLPATTRHVLITLSCFMDEVGRSCFPSVADLVEATGLSKPTIMTHLEAAEAAGWIGVSQHGYRGQRWRRQEYIAKWPERDLASEPVLPLAREQDSTIDEPVPEAEGGQAALPPLEVEAVKPTSEGGQAALPKVVKEVDQDKTSPETPPVTSPESERETRARDGSEPEGRSAIAPAGGLGRASKPDDGKASDGRTLKVFLLAWPSAVVDVRAKIDAAWLALSPEDRTAALDHVKPFLEEFGRVGRGKLQAGWSYLQGRSWELAAERAVAHPKAAAAVPAGQYAGWVVLAPFTRAWWWLLCRKIKRGESVGLMIENAIGRRLGAGVGPGDQPSEEQERAMVQLSRDSSAFEAWRQHFRTARRVEIPKPAFAEFVWMPAERPPGFMTAEDEAEDERRFA